MPTGAPDYFKRILLHGTDEDGNTVAALSDATGRFIFLLSDPEDIWGENVSIGLGELIAGLTPLKRWDRRGQVVQWTDFTEGIELVETTLSGTGAAAAISDTYFQYGGYSLKLTAGSDSSKSASGTIHLSVPVTNGMGLECGICLKQNLDYVQLEILIYDGTNYHRGRVRWGTTAAKWEYYDSAGSWQDLATSLGYEQLGYLFRWFKLVIDPVADTYLRFLHQGGEIDMSAYALQSAASSIAPRIECIITAYSKGATNGIAYVDPIIITHNES